MVTSVEAGSQSLDHGRQTGAEERTTWPESRLDLESPVDPDIGGLNSNPELDSYLAVQNIRQLPSPSPTPSPRSTSPALVVTDSSADSTGTLCGVPNGHGYSKSVENSEFSIPALQNNDQAILTSPLPTPKTLPPQRLHDIPEEKIRKPRKLSTAKANGDVLKLSAAEMEELTSAPESLPVTSPARLTLPSPSLAPSPVLDRNGSASDIHALESDEHARGGRKINTPESLRVLPDVSVDRGQSTETTSNHISRRPGFTSRAISTPPTASNRMSSYTKAIPGQISPRRKPVHLGARPEPLDLNHSNGKHQNGGIKSSGLEQPSPMPQSIPIPPMSIPTYLQLELSSARPSPLYIYRTAASEYPYESSKVKFERLLNFLILPPQLEQVLYFGSLACLDAWLHTFTILPLRFFKAAGILIQWWGQVLAKEARFISGFIYHGSGRMWHRQRGRRGSTDSTSRSRSVSRASRPPASTTSSYQSRPGTILEVPNGGVEALRPEVERKPRQGWGRRHRRAKSHPSSLSSYHKADLLQGAVIVCSCIILMKLDASRMYHYIRGQSAIKLYVIFNALEVRALLAIIEYH
jgi:Eukaryotic membrane protein family